VYNKLFTKILDSSIWLAPDPHRLVWITFLAAMDEDGNAMFASAGNVAARARVTREQAEAAIASFEGPDADSGDQEYEGRRIERFPGGWHVLNAAKYRALVTKAIIREQTKARTARWREKRAGDGVVTQEERKGDDLVTTSEALALVEAIPGLSTNPNTPPHPPKGGARKRATQPEIVPIADLIATGIDEATAAEFIAHKSRVKAPLTARAWADHCTESKKAGWSPAQAAQKVMARSWKGFEAKYVASEPVPLKGNQVTPKTFRERDEERATERFHAMTGNVLRRPKGYEGEINVDAIGLD
jgi:hypothetical protein